MIDIAFIRNEWIPALRSGNYRQTTNCLGHTTKGKRATYCCLGVVARKLPNAAFSRVSDAGLGGDVYKVRDTTTDRHSMTLLPSTLGDQIGIIMGRYIPVPPSVEGGTYKTPSGLTFEVLRIDREQRGVDVTILNDDKKYSFKQIANVLEHICALWDEYEAQQQLDDMIAQAERELVFA
jgi:hypothetical protein